MSEPLVVVSAISKLEPRPDFKKVWEEELKPYVEDFEYEDWTDEQDSYMMSSAKFNGRKVSINYHSQIDGYVVEIIFFEGPEYDLSIKGFEKELEKINETFDRKFTLCAYGWYTGVDRTGAK